MEKSFERDRKQPPFCPRRVDEARLPASYFNKANGIGLAEVVYLGVEWRGRSPDRGSQGRRERRAMMEPSVHRDPRIINIDDLRPLFGPAKPPLLRAIAPVYEPAGISLSSRPSARAAASDRDRRSAIAASLPRDPGIFSVQP